jgi:hypothetical protein
MLRGLRSSSVSASAPLLLAAAFASCGGGSGAGPFQVTSVNVANQQIWKINRPIRVQFSEPVDPLSVNLNTFNVRRVGGGPAAGEFYFEDGNRTLVFQPFCPTRDDLSDAGLLGGPNPATNGTAFQYEINIVGADINSTLPLRAANGDGLTISQTRNFTTPSSLEPLDLYLDPQLGPPTPIILGETLSSRVQSIIDRDPSLTQELIYSYVQVGGANGTRHFFRRLGNGSIELDPPVELPLNKLSDESSRVEFVINFDQPVTPSATNINSARLRLEYANPTSLTAPWVALPTALTIERNCTQIGARIRLAPVGGLPSGATLRAVVTPEFTDLVGENNPQALNDFAIATTVPFPAAAPTLVADQVLETFATADNEDDLASFNEPLAQWENGELRARWAFTGTGGVPGGFDWYIAPGETVIFNTTNSTINGFSIPLQGQGGGVSFDPTQLVGDATNPAIFNPPFAGTLTVIGGVVDVRNVFIEQGATLIVEGPNPLVVQASGDVFIRGQILASGSNSLGVNTFNTTNVPEPGAPGQAGGGRGGTGSPLTTASSARGGSGQGAFGLLDAGGRGGEAGWSASVLVERRRGAGGGGGRLAADVAAGVAGAGPFEQRRIGFDAEPGFAQGPTANDLADNGAIGGPGGPSGGATGLSPFTDADTDNDFFGSRFTVGANTVKIGELTRPWAGAGGGGGGDSAQITSGSFPAPWVPTGDEKGAGGGGGGGSVHVLALGSIRFGPNGRIQARGGIGGGGENTNLLDRVGGGSGGGSGGHVVLQTAAQIDFRSKTVVSLADTATSGSLDTPQNNWAINVLGGQGGAGANDLGGGFFQSPNGQRETLPNNDACPPGYPTNGANSCRGLVQGAGGDGGPGLIQLHTPGGRVGTALTDDVRVSGAATLAGLCAPPPICPLGANGPGGQACFMVPTFGRTSRARSEWIALGNGGFNPATGSFRTAEFSFGGVNTANGAVLATGGVVDPIPPLTGLSAASVAIGGNVLPLIEAPAGQTLVISGAGLVGDSRALRTTPALLRGHSVLLSAGPLQRRFEIVAASFNPANQRFSISVDVTAGTMLAFVQAQVGPVAVAVEPTFFRIASSGAADSLPAPADVRIRFQTAPVDPVTGLPNVALASPLTADVATLNGTTPRFVRFEVAFDIGPITSGVSSPPIPALQFLRLPFLYR